VQRPFSLYDTRRRQVAPLEPIHPGKISIYTCGPTVYGHPHIGNYRTFIFEDVLVKTLRHMGYDVVWVMNITDVGELTANGEEDKMEVGARRDGITAWEVAKRYEQSFLADLPILHIAQPDHLVRATDTIPEQITLIVDLEVKGYTYVTSDGVYYDSSKFSRYADFAHIDVAGLQAGARIEIGEKRHATDFALWKFTPKGHRRDMEWESPWGKGFPGWHIECSAIAMKVLGPELDIHCGGIDHIPVHHTNEIAQSEVVSGKQFARHWCHTEFLLVDDTKMSKSLGNLFTLADILEREIDPLAFRLYLYSATYHAKLNFTWEGVYTAQRNLYKLRNLSQLSGTGEEVADTYIERFEAAMADDINTPQALAVVWEMLRAPLSKSEKERAISVVESIFSLDLLHGSTGEVGEGEVPEEVSALLTQREIARHAKDWSEADRLREEITAHGYDVEDTAKGPLVKHMA
jgi:cysteinyl-tRNA synthetase